MNRHMYESLIRFCTARQSKHSNQIYSNKKQEPKYTEPNKTQVDTMKLTRTQQDTGEDNETGKH